MARRSDHSRAELTKLALESARDIVRQNGLASLSGRKVTSKIGYTIGTLYQLFEDMDELVERMNTETLKALYLHCEKELSGGTVATKLKALARRFSEFVAAHPQEWNAVMSYRFKDTHAMSDEYNAEIQRLFGLMERATEPLYAQDQHEEQTLDMALLWTSLTGLLGVASSERELMGGTVEDMADRLIDMYLRSRSSSLGP